MMSVPISARLEYYNLFDFPRIVKLFYLKTQGCGAEHRLFAVIFKEKVVRRFQPNPLIFLVGRAGLEPATR